jgi:hypothetical protein
MQISENRLEPDPILRRVRVVGSSVTGSKCIAFSRDGMEIGLAY